MTFYQFSVLDLDVQVRVVWNGIFLETRFDPGYKILLYAVGDFYVEVYYSNILNEITTIKPFMYIDFLKPYLDNIDISDMDKL
jgi:hypothetical protein